MEYTTAWCNDKDGRSMVSQRFLSCATGITAYISNFDDIKWRVDVHYVVISITACSTDRSLNKLLVLDVMTLIIMNVQEISLKLCHKLPLPVSLEE